jgi:hypothetical protein
LEILFFTILCIIIFLLNTFIVNYLFYRKILKPLPNKINEIILSKKFENEITEIAKDVADEIRFHILELESERLDAIVEYEALKRKRLNDTESARRKSLKEAANTLDKKIKGLYNQINSMYAPDILVYLEKYEKRKLVNALNNLLDSKDQQ